MEIPSISWDAKQFYWLAYYLFATRTVFALPNDIESSNPTCLCWRNEQKQYRNKTANMYFYARVERKKRRHSKYELILATDIKIC